MSERSSCTAGLMMTSEAMGGILPATVGGPCGSPRAPDPWGAVVPPDSLAGMRHTEFWARMERVLGAAYVRTWAEQQVLGDLGNRTVEEALAAGEPPKEVW